MTKNKGISGRAFGIIFLIVGLLVGIGGTFAVKKSLNDQKKCTETTIGTLVRYDEKLETNSNKRNAGGGSRKTMKIRYYPVFEFTVDGGKYSIVDGNLAKETMPYEIGATIEIHYDPDDPDNSYIVPVSGAFIVFPIVIGGIFSVIGLLVAAGVLKVKNKH